MSKSNTQKVLNGISSQTLVTIVLGIVEIVSFSIMSRLLTKEDFGYFAALTAITTIFSSFSETGIGSALIQRKEINQRFIDNAFTLNLLFGGFITLLLLLLAGPLSDAVIDSSMKKPLMLMSITLMCQCLTSVNFSLMKRRLEFLRVGLIQLFSLVVTTVVAVVLALKGFGYYSILTKVVLDSVIMMILSYLFVNTKFGFALDKNTFISIFKFSGWLMASTVFRNIAHYLDRLLMPKLLSVQSLGAYNRPKDFITKISTKLNGIFDTALFPVLSGIQDDTKRLRNAFRRSFYYMNIFAMFVTLALVFNSELIIRIFFGREWLELTGLTMVISFSLLFNIDGRLADCYLRSLAMTKQQFFFRAIETIISLISVLIGYRWGIMGVALCALFSNSIIKLIKVIYVSSKIDVSIGDFFHILLCSWRFALFVVPPTIISSLLLQHSLLGNIIVLAIFCIMCFMVFLVFPQCVGKEYKTDAHQKVISFIKRKLLKA